MVLFNKCLHTTDEVTSSFTALTAINLCVKGPYGQEAFFISSMEGIGSFEIKSHLKLNCKLVHTICCLIFRFLVYFLKPVTLLFFLHLGHGPLLAIVLTQWWYFVILLLLVMLKIVGTSHAPTFCEPHPHAYRQVVFIQQCHVTGRDVITVWFY